MTKSEPKQHFTLLATLASNANLHQFSTEQIQVGIAEPERSGQEFEKFIRNGFRVQIGDFFCETGEVTIEIPALPRPTLVELREKFPWIKKENGIERDTSPTGPVTLKFGTVLRPSEERINGVEYEQRLTSKLGIALGYQQWNWVFERQSEYSDLMALLGKIYIDFPGLVVVYEGGNRNYPYLIQFGKRFDQRWDWLDNNFNQNGRIAFSGK